MYAQIDLIDPTAVMTLTLENLVRSPQLQVQNHPRGPCSSGSLALASITLPINHSALLQAPP
jgi:hypothetical protein